MFYIREMGIENINVVDIREKMICGAVCVYKSNELHI